MVASSYAARPLYRCVGSIVLHWHRPQIYSCTSRFSSVNFSRISEHFHTYLRRALSFSRPLVFLANLVFGSRGLKQQEGWDWWIVRPAPGIHSTHTHLQQFGTLDVMRVCEIPWTGGNGYYDTVVVSNAPAGILSHDHIHSCSYRKILVVMVDLSLVCVCCIAVCCHMPLFHRDAWYSIQYRVKAMLVHQHQQYVAYLSSAWWQR